MPHVIQPERRRSTGASTPSPVIAPEVRQSLLALARLALGVAAGRIGASALGRALTEADDDGRGAVFVTLSAGGALRGCVGSLEADRSLRNAVVAATVDAALDDPRFIPVAAEELPTMRIDISVLGRPVPLSDPGSFQPGVDGVIVERNGHRGLLLPEVATEFSWGAPQMLAAVCRKAGLPADAWRDPRTRIRTFRTVRFGGPATNTH